MSGRAAKRATITVSLTGKNRITLLAVVDPDRKIRESNEKNNESKKVVSLAEAIVKKEVAVSETLPDFYPVTLTLDKENVVVGDSVTVKARVKNTGNTSNQIIPVAFFVDDAEIETKKVLVPVHSIDL